QGAIQLTAPDTWDQRRQKLVGAGQPLASWQQTGTVWHRRAARQCVLNGNSLGALWHLNRVVSALPSDAQAHMERGGVHTERGEWSLALADFSRALETGGENPEVRLLQAIAQ